MPWKIIDITDPFAGNYWHVLDEKGQTVGEFPSEKAARRWLKQQHLLRCAECGMSRGEWEIEESLHPGADPCCDEDHAPTGCRWIE